MKNYILFCSHQGRGTVSLQQTEDRGKMIAEVLKAGFAIYSILELTDEEAQSFKDKMNEKIAPPPKPMTLIKG